MEQAYAQALYTAIAHGAELREAIRTLAARLEREGRMRLLPRIARAFERVARRESGKARTRLSVARHADAGKARQAASKYADVPAHDVAIDETLIGGWRLEREDVLVDASYKRQLLDLFNRMIA